MNNQDNQNSNENDLRSVKNTLNNGYNGAKKIEEIANKSKNSKETSETEDFSTPTQNRSEIPKKKKIKEPREGVKKEKGNPSDRKKGVINKEDVSKKMPDNAFKKGISKKAEETTKKTAEKATERVVEKATEKSVEVATEVATTSAGTAIAGPVGTAIGKVAGKVVIPLLKMLLAICGIFFVFNAFVTSLPSYVFNGTFGYNYKAQDIEMRTTTDPNQNYQIAATKLDESLQNAQDEVKKAKSSALINLFGVETEYVLSAYSLSMKQYELNPSQNEELTSSDNKFNANLDMNNQYTLSKSYKVDLSRKLISKLPQLILNRLTSIVPNTPKQVVYGGKNSQEAIGSYVQLVNSENPLPEDYKPNDLVTFEGRTSQEVLLRKDASEALKNLFDEADRQGVDSLYAGSGYRDYAVQAYLYENDEGRGEVAPPGISEHQLGLAIDVTSINIGMRIDHQFDGTIEDNFMRNNAHNYGFIMSYKGKDSSLFESWHYRYVGLPLSVELNEKDISLEEYISGEQGKTENVVESKEVEVPIEKKLIFEAFFDSDKKLTDIMEGAFFTKTTYDERIEYLSQSMKKTIDTSRRKKNGMGISSGEYVWPTEGYPMGGADDDDWGDRFHPILLTVTFHDGVDIPAPEGTPIVAAKEGKVIYSADAGAYGNKVEIQHEKNVMTFYAHMISTAVNEGDIVKKGQIIGYVGTTGRSNGNHLHFGCHVNGESYDPMLLYQATTSSVDLTGQTPVRVRVTYYTAPAGSVGSWYFFNNGGNYPGPLRAGYSCAGWTGLPFGTSVRIPAAAGRLGNPSGTFIVHDYCGAQYDSRETDWPDKEQTLNSMRENNVVGTIDIFVNSYSSSDLGGFTGAEYFDAYLTAPANYHPSDVVGY
ncbi:MAG: peptidoglycan DD-metalloendopeptidase family protein [Eubacteriaceae bacterium]